MPPSAGELSDRGALATEVRAWAVMGINVFLGLRFGVWGSEDADVDRRPCQRAAPRRDEALGQPQPRVRERVHVGGVVIEAKADPEHVAAHVGDAVLRHERGASAARRADAKRGSARGVRRRAG